MIFGLHGSTFAFSVAQKNYYLNKGIFFACGWWFRPQIKRQCNGWEKDEWHVKICEKSSSLSCWEWISLRKFRW